MILLLDLRTAFECALSCCGDRLYPDKNYLYSACPMPQLDKCWKSVDPLVTSESLTVRLSEEHRDPPRWPSRYSRCHKPSITAYCVSAIFAVT